MNSVISGNAEAKDEFKYLTSNQVRSIVAKFVKNKDILEELVNMVDDQVITGFQLKDLMRANYSLEHIKAAIEAQIALKATQNYDPRVLANDNEDDSEDEEVAKKRKDFDRILRWGSPDYDIEALLKETGAIPEEAPVEVKIDAEVAAKAGLEFVKENNNVYAKLGKPGFVMIEEKKAETEEKKSEEKPEGGHFALVECEESQGTSHYEKEDTKKEEKKEKPKKTAAQLMKEQNITKTLFWCLEEGDFENILEIKEFGVRKKLMKRIKQIMTEFTFTKEKEDMEIKRLTQD